MRGGRSNASANSAANGNTVQSAKAGTGAENAGDNAIMLAKIDAMLEAYATADEQKLDLQILGIENEGKCIRTGGNYDESASFWRNYCKCGNQHYDPEGQKCESGKVVKM